MRARARGLTLRRDVPPLGARDVQPIFEKRCQPCHFTGRVMYENLPFDRGATIAKLGTKVFSRIKDEEARAKIRRFLDAQGGG